jgi:hypothetical protein
MLEYWNIGEQTTKSLEMSLPQDGFLALNPSFQDSIIPSFQEDPFPAEPMVSDLAHRKRFSSMQ